MVFIDNQPDVTQWDEWPDEHLNKRGPTSFGMNMILGLCAVLFAIGLWWYVTSDKDEATADLSFGVVTDDDIEKAWPSVATITVVPTVTPTPNPARADFAEGMAALETLAERAADPNRLATGSWANTADHIQWSVRYPVVDGVAQASPDSAATSKTDAYRDWVISAVPPPNRDAVSFVFIYDEANLDPAFQNYAAAVHQEGVNNRHTGRVWIGFRELAIGDDSTLIHEIGHVLFVGEEDRSGGPCDGFVKHAGTPYEACYAKDTITAKFYEQFWPDAHKNDRVNFVSGYAMTKPSEDIADSFAEFVLRRGRGDLWIVNKQLIAREKLDFFEQFPSMVAARLHIREALGLPG